MSRPEYTVGERKRPVLLRNGSPYAPVPYLTLVFEARSENRLSVSASGAVCRPGYPVGCANRTDRVERSHVVLQLNRWKAVVDATLCGRVVVRGQDFAIDESWPPHGYLARVARTYGNDDMVDKTIYERDPVGWLCPIALPTEWQPGPSDYAGLVCYRSGPSYLTLDDADVVPLCASVHLHKMAAIVDCWLKANEGSFRDSPPLRISFFYHRTMDIGHGRRTSDADGKALASRKHWTRGVHSRDVRFMGTVSPPVRLKYPKVIIPWR